MEIIYEVEFAHVAEVAVEELYVVVHNIEH